MNEIQKDIRLLPTYFKKIAWGIMLLTVLFAVLSLSKIINIDKKIIRLIIESSLLISLLLLALTRSKIEDELTLRIRLKAFTASFVYGVLFVIIGPFINLLFGDKSLMTGNVFALLVSMFTFYFIMMFIMKRNR